MAEISKIKLLEIIAFASYGENKTRLNLRGLDLSDNDFSKLDFSFANLAKSNLSNSQLIDVDFQNAILTDSKIENVEFGTSIFSNAELGYFNQCNFEGAKFENAHLIKGRNNFFGRTQFYKCSIIFDLLEDFNENNLKPKTVFQDCEFNNSKIEGRIGNQNFGISIFFESKFKDAYFYNCFFSSGTIKKINSRRTTFRNCSFSGNFTFFELEGDMEFINCEFDMVEFGKIDEGISFYKCSFDKIRNIDETGILKCKFIDCSLSKENMR